MFDVLPAFIRQLETQTHWSPCFFHKTADTEFFLTSFIININVIINYLFIVV